MHIPEHIAEESGTGTTLVESRPARFWTRFGFAALLLALGCGQETTAPDDLGSLSFLIVSGNAQSGVVGTELPQPVVVKATKSNGQALAGVTVTFRVTSGGGSVFAGAATTGTNGIAQEYWTLGTSTAELQQLEVRAVLSTGQKQVYGVFTATPLAGPPTQIAMQDGDGQTAGTSSSVPIAPEVLVTDQYGNPVPGWSVTFAVASGGGSVTGGNATTSPSGVATVGSWTLGPAAGDNSLIATATGSGIAANPVTFVATAVVISDTWTTKASMPTGRWGLGVATINGILYAVGGRDAGGVPLATVEAYDPATDSWTTKASLPTLRSELGVATIDGILYAVGGYSGADVLATVDAYDPTTDTWTTKASMPTARTGLGVATANGILYAVGGANTTFLATVEAYDPATDTWTTKASMPFARADLGLDAVNGVLYAVGGIGGSGGNNNFVVAVQAYDPVTDRWTTKASMPEARGRPGVAAIGGILYAIGGQNIGGIMLGTVEVYDPTADTWGSKGTPQKAGMPTQRCCLGAAAINGILYAVGGRGIFSALSTVEVYQP